MARQKANLPKQVQINLKLYIISFIKNNKKLPSDVPKNKIAYHLKPFKKAGLVVKKGYGVWELTSLGLQYLTTSNFEHVTRGKPTSNNFNSKGNEGSLFISRKRKKKLDCRGHGFMFKLDLKIPIDWSSKLTYLKKSGLLAEPLKTKVIRTYVYNHKVHLARNSIIIYFSKELNYFGENAQASKEEALFEFQRIIKRLENLLKTSFRQNKGYKFKIRRQHYGNIENPLAKVYRRDNKTLTVKENGKSWLLIDWSDKKYVEIETIDTERADVDYDKVVMPFFNLLRQHPRILYNLMEVDVSTDKAIKTMGGILEKHTEILRALVEREHTSINIDKFKY